jgi:class 3 adenylate cyclase/tetratricopeptide (TPR) repeat protein
VCPSCSAINAADQRYCTSCGSALGPRCPSCGASNSIDARFCGTCGSPLIETGSAQELPREHLGEERKVVSVLFADLVGSTASADGADPEDIQARLRPYYARVRDEIESVGGTVEKFIGDAVVGVFGAPTSHEDDPSRAVQAAIQVVGAIEHLNEQDPQLALAVRVAVDTGEAVVSLGIPAERGEAIATGDVMNTASRLQQVAPVGGIVVGQRTFLATREAFDYESLDAVTVKGKAEPLPIWRVRGTRSEQERPELAPMIGRAPELQLLATLWDKVRADRRPHMVTVIGPPGIGKSRLVRELQPTLEADGVFLKGRCRPYGETTGFGAFGQQVQQLAGVYETDPSATARTKLSDTIATLFPNGEADEVSAHLAVLLGLSDEGAPDKQLLFYSVRRFVEALGSRGPTVLFFEDIHWAEPALLELLDSLATRLRDVPVYLITLARPELLDTRPNWGGGLTRYTAIPLDPLPDADARQLAGSLLAASSTGDELADRLVNTGGGNPLFLEELAASVAERAPGLASDLPSTVQAIIAARLDGLPATERRVLQDAAAIGRIFWLGPLAAIAGNVDLDAALDFLESRDLIRRQPASSVPDDREFIFKHVLTREVAYATLPRAARRERHRMIAEYIEGAAGDRIRGSASILAHHFREAGDDVKTATYLMIAADVASRAWAKDQAITLYTEAIELMERVGDPAGLVEARLARASTQIDAARFNDAIEGDLDWLLGEATGRSLGLAHLARSRAAYWLADAKHVVEHSTAAAAIAATLDDDELEGRALAARSEAEAMGGDLPAAFATWEQAVTRWPTQRRDASFARFYATRSLMAYWAGDYEAALRMATEVHELGVDASNLEAAVTSACNAGLALTGLSRHEEGLLWLDRAIALGREWEEHSFRFTSRAQNMRAGVLRELGDVSGAREQSHEALELAKDSGFPPAAVSARLDLVYLDLLEADVGAVELAVPDLVEALEGTKGFHQWLWSIRLATARAEAALLGGQAEEAARFAGDALDESDRIGRRKYVCRARTVLGRALSELGRHEEAATALQTAVSEAEALGHLPSRWTSLASLADALSALGDDQAAAKAWAAARAAVEAFAAGLQEQHRDVLFARPEVIALRSSLT